MKDKSSITAFELILVIVIIIFAFMIFMPTSNIGVEDGKRAVCLNNLKSLTTAWGLYADNNLERIVAGQAYHGADGTNGVRDGNEPYWTGDDIADPNFSRMLPESVQISAIESGALWQYIQNIDVYKCPVGEPGAMRTYSIVDSMNGKDRTQTEQPDVYIKNRLDIKDASARIVFIDQGLPTAGSFGVYYDKELWLNPPVVRHGGGVTLSFADRHVDYWKWMGEKTLDLTRHKTDMQPESEDDYQDLYKFQKGVWGQLGYEPTFAPE